MSSYSDLSGLLKAQVPGANSGPSQCRSIAEGDNAAQLVLVQTIMTLPQMYEEVIGALATVREARNSSVIVSQYVDDMLMYLSAEGGPCQESDAELRAYLVTGADAKRTICITEKLLNRDVSYLTMETEKANAALVRHLAELIIKRILKLHRPSSEFKPYSNYVSAEQVRKLHMQAFNCLGGKNSTQRFAKVVSAASRQIGAAKGAANYLVMPNDLVPMIETGDLVAMSSEFVDDRGFLARAVNSEVRPVFGKYPIIVTQGDMHDPLVGQTRVLQHYCNGGNACDSGNRTIKIQDINTGKNVAVDLEAAIDALRVFGPDGEINETVSSVINKYRREGGTEWHKKHSQHYDPYVTRNMGIWTYHNSSGEKEQSRVFGHIPMSRSVQEGFARSVLKATQVSGLEPLLTKLESLLKDIHRQTPADDYWTALLDANATELVAGNSDETGARRDAEGNNWGVLNHPSLIPPTAAGYNATYANVQAGYGTGPGLKYLAEAGRGNGPLFDTIAQIVDACEIVGQQLATVAPDWANGPRPAWYHGLEYSVGCRLIDSMVFGGVNLALQGGRGADQTKRFYGRVIGPRDGANAAPVARNTAALVANEDGLEFYLGQIVAALDDDIYGTQAANVSALGVIRDQTPVNVQGQLIGIINANPDYKEVILPILNRVAALRVAGTRFAGVASFDVRAALVFQAEQVADHPLISQILRNLFAGWQGSSKSTVDVSVNGMPGPDVIVGRTIVRKVAAAIAGGNRPYRNGKALEGEALSEWYHNLGLDDDAADAILARRPVTALTGRDADQSNAVRLPLVLSGQSATGVNLPAGTAAVAASSGGPAVPAQALVLTDPATPFGNVGAAQTALSDDSIYSGNTIGAQYGAAPRASSSSSNEAQEFANEYEPPVVANNKRIARTLKTPYKVILLAFFNARINAANLRGMFSCHGIDVPLALLLVRAPFFQRAEHVILTEGAGANEIVHEPVRVSEHRDDCGEMYKANIIVTASGIVRRPQSSAVIPNAYVQDPIRHTADVSFMDQTGHGALMPILVPRDWHCPEMLNLNGIDEHGNIHLESAPILYALWYRVIAEITNKDFLWGEEGISYQGEQITYDHTGNAREIASAGCSTNMFYGY